MLATASLVEGRDMSLRFVALQKTSARETARGKRELSLGSYRKELEALHGQFIQEINHTNEGVEQHFRRSLGRWRTVVMAISGDSVVGYAALEQNEEKTMDLDTLFVRDTHRRQGVSKQLVAGAEYMARQMGADYLQTIVAGEGVHREYLARRGYAHYPGGWKFIRKAL